MPQVTLPDGSKRDYKDPVTVAQIAQSIGAGLAKAALAGRVDGELVDTSYLVAVDSDIAIVTERDDDGLEVLRHSCAHLMAQAVQRLFPKAQVTIGPVIEDGFFYDFAFERTFTPEDLAAIEKTMGAIVKENLDVERSVLARKEAIALFKEMGEDYKVEIIESIPGEEDLSFYRQGEFIDLCRGPHVPNTSKFKAFKLTNVAGAYWRGDSEKEMLQRVYGTAWASKKDLELYLERLEEAEKRDHRKLGKQLGLFHFQEEAPGMAFWHPKGWKIYQIVKDYMQKVQNDNNYQEISTPQLVDFTLWEKSGHASKFSEEMFSVESDNRTYALKPMNCPCHIQVFNQGLKSYRDLPLRMAEFGSCHRYEPSGSMHGLMRVRSFVQDDGHIFCTDGQIESETGLFIEFLSNLYADLGFKEFDIKLSTRPEMRVGSDEVWDKAEKALEAAIKNLGYPYRIDEGDGAFYGPKLDFVLTDAIGREWQCGTFQLDFNLAERLNAQYVGEDGKKHIPVMIHRAVLGSFERFIGILIENYAGKLPFWLAPQQVVIASIISDVNEYSIEIMNLLKKEGIRAEVDLRNEKISYKVREHSSKKVPIILAIGNNEKNDRSVSIRRIGSKDTNVLKLDEAIQEISRENSA